jgi:hypothetical protein
MKGQCVGLSITLALPISSCNFSQWVFFGQERNMIESQELLVPKIAKMKD